MLLPIRGIDGRIGNRVAAMYYHAVTNINSYMAYRTSAVICPGKKDNIPRLSFAWCDWRCVVEKYLVR